MRHGQWKRRKSKFEKRKRRKEERGINILQQPGKKRTRKGGKYSHFQGRHKEEAGLEYIL